MAWKKGAVVIVKRGDEEWADAIEEVLDIQKASRKELEELENENKELENENKELKRSKDMTKIHDDKFTDNMIAKLEREYGNHWTPPKWVRWILEAVAFVVYWISLFVDKYLVIK